MFSDNLFETNHTDTFSNSNSKFDFKLIYIYAEQAVGYLGTLRLQKG
jgi:hypothetical protein